MINLKQISANLYECHINDKIYWFSYDTLIGYHRNGVTLVAKNTWGNTTGKHINYIKEHYNCLVISEDDLQRGI
jgi:peptidyl-tRNA hydrolase